jgi:hypothetical protein
MDLETMMFKIDSNQYETANQFLYDIDLITNNALEYNPARDSNDRQIRHRACALRDLARELIDAELDSDFEEMCQQMFDERQQRGEEAKKDIPKMLLKPVAVEPQQPTINVKQDDDTEIESLHENGQESKAKVSPLVNESSAPNPPRAPSNYKRKGKKKRSKAPASLASSSHSQDNSLENMAKSDESNDATTVSQEQNDSMETHTTETTENIETPEEITGVTTGKIIIPQESLDKLLKKVVSLTNDCTFDQLENLYWTLFRTMRKRIRNADRTALIDVSCPSNI